jgi:hypothetical protein
VRTVAILLLLALPLAAAPDALSVRWTVTADFPVSDLRVVDDIRDRLLVVGLDGQVRTWSVDDAGALRPPLGSLVLPDPRFTLLALTDGELLVLSRDGARLCRPAADGAFGPECVVVAPQARFRMRTGRPLFADIVQDINGDMVPDVVVPGVEESEVWIGAGEEGGVRGLRRVASVAVDVDRIEAMAAENLSDRLECSFLVPRLRTADVNGDGRLDLLVESGRTRAFHMQGADGTIPPAPDVSVDLSIFRDTTPAAAIRPGRTLAGGDRPQYRSLDLDGDKVPDYVIAHRRKVWVFHGNRERPQFTEPSSILKVSDDVTTLLLARLNDDAFPDLLLFKVQVPTVATLLLGALGEWEVEVTALGYASEGGRTFSRTPAWKSEISVRLPSILRILKNPGALLDRFEEAGKKFRRGSEGDLDGDGAAEMILESEDRARLEVWRGTGKGTEKAEELDALMRRILFEEGDRVWNLDRILEFFESLAEQRARSLTGGRPPDATLPLREDLEYAGFELCDLDGDGRREILVRYSPSTFDIVGLAPRAK